MQRLGWTAATAVALGLAGGAHGATPQQRCAAAKATAAGAKVYAKAKCQQKALITGTAVATACLTKAEQKFVTAFGKADAVGSCPGDAAAVEGLVDGCLASFTSAITGDAKCAAAKIKAVGMRTYAKAKCHRKALLMGTAVDPACLGEGEGKFTRAMGKADGKGMCSGTAQALEVLVDGCPASLQCFQDLGDGTIRDICTGLQWEKKTHTAGLHDVTSRYTWAGCCNGDCFTSENLCQPNAAAAATCVAQASGGTAGCSVCGSGTCNVDPLGVGASTTVWDWINQVNLASFGGHSDWRLPSEQGLNTLSPTPRELETILLAPYICGRIPCIDSIFGPTQAGLGPYWSATTLSTSPDFALGVFFFDGAKYALRKSYSYYVRAVRSVP